MVASSLPTAQHAYSWSFSVPQARKSWRLKRHVVTTPLCPTKLSSFVHVVRLNKAATFCLELNACVAHNTDPSGDQQSRRKCELEAHDSNGSVKISVSYEKNMWFRNQLQGISIISTSQESVFHSRTDLSSPELDRYFPIGSQAIPLTQPLWPDNVRIGLDMMDCMEDGSTFHIKIVLSILQEASIRSSGDHAKSCTSKCTKMIFFSLRECKASYCVTHCVTFQSSETNPILLVGNLFGPKSYARCDSRLHFV